jgi:hypothetical protein
MINFRITMVMMLIAGIIAGGCQSGSPVTITEYRPKSLAIEKPAPSSDVVVLWQWMPVVPATGGDTTTPSSRPVIAPQHPVEVIQIFAERGSPVGFRRRNGHLIAIAGPTTRPLAEAHYEWKTMRAPPDQAKVDFAAAANAVLITVAVVAIVGLIFWGLHDNRHRDWTSDIFNSN